MKRKHPVNFFVILVLLAGLWPVGGLAQEAKTFTDFGSGTTLELFSGGATWKLNWGQGPWTWFAGAGDSLLDAQVSSILTLRTLAPADTSDELMATLQVGGTMVLSAHDPCNADNVIGTLTLSGTGVNVIDINASRVIVDEGSGMFLAPFPAPAPKVTFTLEEATGVFAYIGAVGDWDLNFAGSYAVPLIAGMDLQDNIFTALGGNVALIGGIGEFVLTGQYITDETKQAESFCEYGQGINVQFGNPAKWEDTWGQDPWKWHTCNATSAVNLLDASCVSLLDTHHAGADDDYTINADLVYRRDVLGTMQIESRDETDPNQITGSISAQVRGAFIADLNAAHAIETDETLIIAFGGYLLGDPGLQMTDIEMSGRFAGIQPVGAWSLQKSGTVTLVRVPDLSIQDNIFAALGNPDLRLGADEETALTGWYYHSDE